MADGNALKTPNEELAERVVSALQEGNLLKAARAGDAIKKLKAGKVTASDWRMWAEDFIEEAVGHDQHAGN